MDSFEIIPVKLGELLLPCLCNAIKHSSRFRCFQHFGWTYFDSIICVFGRMIVHICHVDYLTVMVSAYLICTTTVSNHMIRIPSWLIKLNNWRKLCVAYSEPWVFLYGNIEKASFCSAFFSLICIMSIVSFAFYFQSVYK